MGWIDTVDVGLTRTLFSWTLHPIVYFWLFPAYIAFYTMAPQAAGGRLYSDTLGRLSFVLLLLYSLPVGMHHLLMDPTQSTGFKFVQMMLTILVSVPTLLTVFTIAASMEIAGRLRGGRGLFGWIPALPWDRAAHRLRERGSAQRYGIAAKLRKDEIEKIAEYYAAVRLFRPQD